MNKSELIRKLSEKTQLPPDEASLVVHLFFDSMKDALLHGGRVEIRGFGSFKLKKYEPYLGRNPKTGAAVEVGAKQLPFFRPGKEFKEYLNEGKAGGERPPRGQGGKPGKE